jgi:8-amino-7-oxononanoate synthase
MSIVDRLDADLAELDAADLRRRRRIIESRHGTEVVVDGRRAINFCSNDYLGLADEPALTEAAVAGARRWGVGAGASHLVSGHFAIHEAAEARLAAYVGCESALLFSTGYMANAGVMSALVGRGDAIFADKLNHASLVDGALLTRADLKRYPHRDPAALDRLLAQSTAPRKLIVTDSVFSMDGDLAPLAEIATLAETHDAWLMIDDAHGLGVIGPQGRGALKHFDLNAERILYIGTLGKAAGIAGAFAAGSKRLTDWLLQKTRTYIFTTGAPPLLAECLIEAVDLMESGDARRATVQRHIDRLRTGLPGAHLLESTTPIQPLIVGENHKALALAQTLFEQGLWVPAIRPPTVPEGSARLRISLSAAHTDAQIDALTAALRHALAA